MNLKHNVNSSLTAAKTNGCINDLHTVFIIIIYGMSARTLQAQKFEKRNRHAPCKNLLNLALQEVQVYIKKRLWTLMVAQCISQCKIPWYAWEIYWWRPIECRRLACFVALTCAYNSCAVASSNSKSRWCTAAAASSVRQLDSKRQKKLRAINEAKGAVVQCTPCTKPKLIQWLPLVTSYTWRAINNKSQAFDTMKSKMRVNSIEYANRTAGPMLLRLHHRRRKMHVGWRLRDSNTRGSAYRRLRLRADVPPPAFTEDLGYRPVML